MKIAKVCGALLPVVFVGAIIIVQSASVQTGRKVQFLSDDLRLASVIVEDAVAAARRTDKRVFLVFGASWCKSCGEYWEQLHKQPVWEIVNENYVVIRLNILEREREFENEGGLEFFQKLYGERMPDGLPFFVVLDQDGKVIADCLVTYGNVSTNQIGFFSRQGDHFIEVLKKTAPRVSNEQIDRLRDWMKDPFVSIPIHPDSDSSKLADSPFRSKADKRCSLAYLSF